LDWEEQYVKKLLEQERLEYQQEDLLEQVLFPFFIGGSSFFSDRLLDYSLLNSFYLSLL
jgi:hypothetical protein